jgi:hypothetical protein
MAHAKRQRLWLSQKETTDGRRLSLGSRAAFSGAERKAVTGTMNTGRKSQVENCAAISQRTLSDRK